MIIPVILAGGSGTRLWPLSRKSFPKQFAALSEGPSLFQQTLQRLAGEGFAAPTVVTGEDYRFIVAEQVEELGTSGADILLEPEARNTAPAILAAALRHEHDPKAVLVIAPSDHRVEDGLAFAKALNAAAQEAQSGALVTLGIQPTAPETGYGYLALSCAPEAFTAQALEAFIEKPDLKTAEAYLAGRMHLWNAGIFVFTVKSILAAYAELKPELVRACRAALAGGAVDLAFFRLEAEAYGACENISIDYAIMERASRVSVVPVDCGWSDLGSWRAVYQTNPHDENGNVLSGPAMELACENSLLSSESGGARLVGLGLKNVAAIATRDAVLVANMDESEQVKNVVSELKRQQASEATLFKQSHRPWGHYETLALGARFQVKRIMVKPGGRLSLQSHFHRAEHWIVVEGTATVTVDEKVKILTENQAVYVPLGAVHRLENQGKLPLTLIEVQSGAYLGEDDILRFEDMYARADETSTA